MPSLSPEAIEALKLFERHKYYAFKDWDRPERMKELLRNGLIEVKVNIIYPTKTGYAFLELIGAL